MMNKQRSQMAASTSTIATSSPIVAFEGDINKIVKEYLDFGSYKKAARAFDAECKELGRPIAKPLAKPKADAEKVKLQKEIVDSLRRGKESDFGRLWETHVPLKLRTSDATAQKLEFYARVYLAVFPVARADIPEDERASTEEAMTSFRQFLDTRGAELSRTPEFLPFYALPFIPDPKAHPSCKEICSEAWLNDLVKRIDRFLAMALKSKPQPTLFDLYQSGRQPKIARQHIEEMETLKMKLADSESRSNRCLRNLQSMTRDYQELIGITAELIDALEATVRGDRISPEFLQEVCRRLFETQRIEVEESADFSRPGTRADQLRASVVMTAEEHQLQLRKLLTPREEEEEENERRPRKMVVDFVKVKEDLRSSMIDDPRLAALIVQAFRRRLSLPSTPRSESLAEMIVGDVAGIGELASATRMALSSEDATLQQTWVRFLNALASFAAGRKYLGDDDDVPAALIDLLKNHGDGTQNGSGPNNEDPAKKMETNIRDHALATLQKLSLSRRQQTRMIVAGLVEWLVDQLVEEMDEMSDYAIEYALALLMNLCLRSAGKRACVKDDPARVLTILGALFVESTDMTRPYVGGTLYSLLALPRVREEAQSMGLDKVLESNVEDKEAKNQMEFLTKQLWSEAPEPEVDSDDEEESNEEEEEDPEELEEDIERGDPLKAKPGELDGERLLMTKYSKMVAADVVDLNSNTSLGSWLDDYDDAAGACRELKASTTILMRPTTPSRLKDDVMTSAELEALSSPRALRASSVASSRTGKRPLRTSLLAASVTSVVSESGESSAQQPFETVRSVPASPAPRTASAEKGRQSVMAPPPLRLSSASTPRNRPTSGVGEGDGTAGNDVAERDSLTIRESGEKTPRPLTGSGEGSMAAPIKSASPTLSRRSANSRPNSVKKNSAEMLK